MVHMSEMRIVLPVTGKATSSYVLNAQANDEYFPVPSSFGFVK